MYYPICYPKLWNKWKLWEAEVMYLESTSPVTVTVVIK